MDINSRLFSNYLLKYLGGVIMIKARMHLYLQIPGGLQSNFSNLLYNGNLPNSVYTTK